MPSEPPLSDHPCIECAHVGETCRRRRRTVKCVRCVEEGVDCSFHSGEVTSEVDIALPEILDSVDEHLGQSKVEQKVMREMLEDMSKEVHTIRKEQQRFRVDVVLAMGLEKKLLTEKDLEFSDISSTKDEEDDDIDVSAPSSAPDTADKTGGAPAPVGDEGREEQEGDDEVEHRAGEVKAKEPKGKGKAKGKAKKTEDDDEYLPTSRETRSKKKTKTASASKAADPSTTSKEDASDEKSNAQSQKHKSSTSRKSASRVSQTPVASSSNVHFSKDPTSDQGDSRKSESELDSNAKDKSGSKRKRAIDVEERIAKYKKKREARVKKVIEDKVIIKQEPE